MQDINKIIGVYKLEKYFKDVFENSTSNKAPYHNLYHILNTMRNCYKLSKSENLNNKECKNLLIASLFHDFSHSEGKLTDDKNVEIAIKGFEKYSKESKEDNLEIIKLIQATQYPYVIPDNELNFSQKVIRDADLMQTFTDNYFQQVILGFLMTELNKDFKTAIDLQFKFIENLKFYTETAKKIFKDKKESLLDDLKFYKKTLT